MKIYPNPAIDNTIHLSFISNTSETYNIKLYDAVGKVIYQEVIQTAKGINEHTITIPEIAEGMYHIELDNNNEGRIIQNVRF